MTNYHASIHQVYNHYLSQYTPKSASRYDAHKHTDLKNIYHSIVKMEKESPVYLLPRPEEIEDYSIHMKEYALQFRNTVASLGNLEDDSIFGQQAVYSSEPSKAQASILPRMNLTGNDNRPPVKLTIQSLALSQQNEGCYLPSNECNLPSGTYSFDLLTAASNYELQFAISDTDTNLDIQSRLARLINSSNLGVNAHVLQNTSNESALTLSSVGTGRLDSGKPYFTISDENTSQKKGITHYLGIHNITQPSLDTIYSIDGTTMHSSDNTIRIQDRFEVSLLDCTDSDPVLIGTKPDFESLKDNIISLTDSYNTFLQAASSYQNRQPRTNLLVDSMKRMSSFYINNMSNIGITVQNNGQLQVDDSALASSLSSDHSANTIKQFKNFTRAALQKITQIQLNPMAYADMRMVAYKNPLKTHFANPYVTSAYSGMLFNSYM